MISSHLHWDADALWRQLQPLLPGLSVEVLARVESTNTLLMDRGRASLRDAGRTRPGDLDPLSPRARRAGDAQPCLLVAEHQSRGRGRQGRTWLSSAGASLTFSLGLTLAARDFSGLSLAVGVALAEALDPLANAQAPRIGLKWPNDLMLLDAPGQGRKMGGILIETLPMAHQRLVVIGVGLNIRAPAVTDSAWGVADVRELHAQADAPWTLHSVALPLARAVLRFQEQGFAPFQAAFAARDMLAGQVVTTTLAEAPQGRADGVDDSGALCLNTGTQRLRVAAGEVSLRPATLAAPAATVAATASL